VSKKKKIESTFGAPATFEDAGKIKICLCVEGWGSSPASLLLREGSREAARTGSHACR